MYNEEKDKLGDNMKTVVITGSSDGIGKVAAKELVKLGHEVIIIGRNVQKTKAVANSLKAKYFIADFSKLDEINKLALDLNKLPKIDVLINNAGAVFNERKDTIDGIEQTFQVNVLSMFLLTNLLLDKLSESKATVITTTSIAANMFGNKLDLANIDNKKGYSSFKAYGESKLCDLLLTKEFHNRYNERGVSFVAFEPGVPRTNFACEGKALLKFAYHSPLKYLFTSSPLSSAKRMVFLANGENKISFNSGLIYKKNGKIYKEKYKVSNDISKELFDKCLGLCHKYL